MMLVIYAAADELDLFLSFQQKGLYVEPDPVEVRRQFPCFPTATAGERRRFKRQKLQYISSQTDQLDAWHRQRFAAASNSSLDEHEDQQFGVATPTIEKPAMLDSPLQERLEDLQISKPFAWLSIGATLLSGPTDTQSTNGSCTP